MKNLKITINAIEAVDINEWDQFLKTTNESTYFCTSDWWLTYRNSYLLQVRDCQNQLVGGVPFRTLSVLPVIGKFFQFAWLDSSVLVNAKYSSGQRISIKKTAFKHLLKHLNKSNIIVMTISSKSKSYDEMLFKELFNTSEKCSTFIIDLKPDENDIFNAFEKRKKNSIRKAEKLGVEVKILEGEQGKSLLPDYMRLQNKMFEHKSKNYSSVYTKSETHIKRILSSKEKSIIAIAYYNNEPIAANLLVTHKDTIHAYLGASDNKLNRMTNASTLLELKSMLYAKQKGFSYYDLGGVPVETPTASDSLYGIYLYKRGFGGKKVDFDCATHTILKNKYRFVWWLRKYDTHPLAIKAYNFFKKDNPVHS